ncbi:Oidioi.mRNA.OKI2018_I69.chr1.g2643.t1.cds [Oikopleura dioica]|uniref:Oidioi.mRNA.OKI2018_I69.chr1.g2643.t1.cds n=1 Tax=Oikopleura dioica TaxID=34765 RepID=A0ABN7SWZ4_OIKDI|nr:Oidioi.mRNA.OKI2018_I69.chr1.g2643.t1.cds [Oikopleura dioica]
MDEYVAELIQEIKHLDLENEDINKVAEAFAHVDKKKERSVDIDSLGELLDEVGKPLPGFKIRQMLPTLTLKTSGRVNVLEFGSIYHDQVKKDIASSFRKTIDAAEGVVSKTGASSWSTHTYSLEEREAFADWINTRLKDDPDCKNLLPITVDDESLFEKVSDGILLCKLINLSQPETIDERAINKTKLSVYRKQENLNLAINSASAIGCTVVNIGAQDLLESRQHLILGLLWQIIRMGLFANIDLALNPNLKALLMDGEELADLDKLGPEKLLLRWMNYHLARAGYSKTVSNFGKDISDSHAYLNLLAQIQPGDLSPPLSAFCVAGDDLARAEMMLKNADRLGCRAFVTARDVANGHEKLNMAFVANLFNNHPSLEPPEEDENDEVIEETCDERTYRNWMNSLGVQPRVNRLYGDLIDGNVLLQLEDIVRPGIVNWERVNRAPFPRIGAMMKRIENCNYAVDIGKELKYSLVGIAGNDIYDQNRTLTLALVWQIMRGYTTKVLTDLGGNTQIRDAEIVDWVNQTLASGGKTSKISSFKDPSIASSQAILDVIDVLVPQSIDYSVVLSDPSDYEDKLQNAKYALAMGRKIGARIYATPEHVVNVDMKMVLTIFACLMGRGMERT